MSAFLFPRWTNQIRPAIPVVLVGGLVYAIVLVAWGTSARTTAVGYQPEQPVPYSHALHAGELGMDCRYCHTSVETAAAAGVPTTQICMNCHQKIRAESPKLLPVRESFAAGMPIPWVRVHDLPDYVYFNHSAHMSRGVSCVSCHGRVDRMDIVSQVEPLTMGWCLDCHRHPESRLRPAEFVTRLDWTPGEEAAAVGGRIAVENDIHPSTDCWTCHR